jgi:excisionase family DNA binding protein
MKEARAEEEPLLLTVPEAAKLLRISRGLTYELVRQERIPSIRLGRRLLIPMRGLEEWVAREAGLPPPPAAMPFVPQRH